MILRKVFSMRVNFLFFHTVCSMLLFFNSMCVYPFFFSLKTFVDDALCWTKSLLRVVEIWHHWIVDKHGKTFSIPTIFPFVVGTMLSDVCRSICKTILHYSFFCNSKWGFTLIDGKNARFSKTRKVPICLFYVECIDRAFDVKWAELNLQNDEEIQISKSCWKIWLCCCSY